MLQFIKVIIICFTIAGCVYMYIYFSPYQTFMRDCTTNEYGDFGEEYCTWKYFDRDWETNYNDFNKL